MKKTSMRSGLMATTTICGFMAGALVAAAVPTGAQAQTADKKDEKVTEVIVTGSILRKKNLTSITPLTTITSVDLEKRGVTTIESALQTVAGNNGGAMNNNWSAGGGFAAGASGLSLRGLTSNSTLVLVDGMRLAYYPLADDATRNFVDLNTIPDAIVDRVEVLQDGASSTYGADAIAGVVNVITKKNFQGFSGKATVGAREGKGGGVTAISGTWGKGNLGTDGYNFYVSGEYQKNEAFTFAQADAPWNTANQSSICAPTNIADTSKWFPNSGTTASTQNIGIDANGITCRTNSIVNGIQFNDVITGVGSTTVATVRPYDATNTTAQGNWRLLNTADGCRDLTPVTLTANELRRAVSGLAAGTLLCQQDLVKQYNVIQPQDTRKSLSARLTKRFSDTMEGYVAANYYDNQVYYMGRSGPKTIQSVTTPGTAGSSATLASIALPVYICPKTTVGNCTSTNGTLNPNNPFASLGQVARINYTFGDIPYYINTDSENFRIAAGLKGFAYGWNYDLNMTAMKSKLTYTRHGVPNLQHILDVVKDGSYNFMSPSLNTQAVRDYVAPVSVQKSDSEMVDIEANASKSLMDLAGGPMQLGVGASFRYERVKNPSANPDPVGGNKYDRYSNGINPFGATGFRNVQSAFFELDAPLSTKLDVNVGGRVDSYSTGFANFSPKVQSSYKLFDTLMLRGSFSKGFRAPSIAENNSDPSTGFVSLNVPEASKAAFQAAHGGAGTTYGFPYSYGKTTVAAKGLKPETSENTTVGGVWTPTKWLGVSVDYYIIHKHNIIQGGDPTAAVEAYYAGQPIPAGFVVIPGVPDPLYPNALPTIGYVQYTLVNLAAQDTAGIDFSVSGRFDLGAVKWTSVLTGTYMQYYTQTFPQPNGTTKTQTYVGTLGNNTITSGSGTPKRRANWQNSFDFGKFNVSATAYYVDGYKAVAADNGDNVYGTCESSTTASKYRDASTVVKCQVESFSNVDLHGTYKFNSNYSVTLDVLNAFDSHSPYDPSGTYGGPLYNPAFTATGIMGRYWKLSAKVTY